MGSVEQVDVSMLQGEDDDGSDYVADSQEHRSHGIKLQSATTSTRAQRYSSMTEQSRPQAPAWNAAPGRCTEVVGCAAQAGASRIPFPWG